MSGSAKQKIACVISAILLAITAVAAGFWACAAIPFTTEMLSSETSEFAASPYDHDSLMSIAVETRAFTVEDYTRHEVGSAGAESRLAEKILEAAYASSAPDSPTANRWNASSRAVLQNAETGEDPVDVLQYLYAAGPSYALDRDALSHLNDVNGVIANVTPPLIGIAVVAVIMLIVVGRAFGSVALGQTLIGAGCTVLGAFLMLGVWAVVNFSGFFAVFHTLFFAEGSWLFPPDSLLIQMYPTPFWMGMGAVWLFFTCVLSLVSLYVGWRVHRQRVTSNRNEA